MICDVPDKARLILGCVSGLGRTVRTIVVMEALDSGLVTRGQECGIEILSLEDFEVRGMKTTLSYSHYFIILQHLLCLLSTENWMSLL